MVFPENLEQGIQLDHSKCFIT